MKKILSLLCFIFFFIAPAFGLDSLENSIVQRAYLDTKIGLKIPGLSWALTSLSLLSSKQSFFLEGKDPILDLQLVFHGSEEEWQNAGAPLHSDTLFQKVLANIAFFKAHNLSIESAFQNLKKNDILNSTNIKHCLKYPQHANEVANALGEIRSKRFKDGSPPLILEWINSLSPIYMNAALNALLAHGEFTKQNMSAVLNIMQLLNKYPEVKLNAYLIGKSTRYGIDRSFLRKGVTAWEYAYSVVINLTRLVSSWSANDQYLFSVQVRLLPSLSDFLPMIIESYILEKGGNSPNVEAPALFEGKYLLTKYQELMTPTKNSDNPREPINKLHSIASSRSIDESLENSNSIPFQIHEQLFAKLHEDLKEFVMEISKGYDNRTRYGNLAFESEEELSFFDPISLDVMQIPVVVPVNRSVVGQRFCLLSLIEHGVVNDAGYVSIPNTLDSVHLQDILPDRDTQEEFNKYCSQKESS